MSGMRMGLGMDMRLSQQMTLAPRMIQSMEILQMPLAALQERIERELEDNPVLELKNGKAAADDEATAFNADAPLVHDDTGDVEFSRLEELNKDWNDHFNEEHRPSRGHADLIGENRLEAMQNQAEAPITLHEHLKQQLAYLDLPPEELTLTEFVISCLDDDGYIRTRDDGAKHVRPIEPDELAQNYEAMSGEAVTLEDVQDAIFNIQNLEPAGVGARDIRECLLMQISPECRYPNLLRLLIQNHLEDVAHNRIPAIQKRTSADAETIREAIEELKHLDPRPGARFSPSSTHYVVPDVIVERQEDGTYDIRLTDDWEPRIRIPKRYYEMAKNKSNDAKTREFLKSKLTSAEWLLDAIQQRRRTLINVTREIIEHQKDFLEKGPDHIHPLKMEQIAEKVGVHITTVSRAVDDKWAQTPRGLFPLRRFFGGGTRNAQTGEEVAWEKIRQTLQDFISSEDKTRPLSDEEIVDKFQDRGITVARRTVTKYREALNIPSSRQRRQWAG